MGSKKGNRGRPSASTGRELDKSKAKHPRKRMYRARAHSNPFNDPLFDVPLTPDHIDWSLHYPKFFQDPTADAGEKPIVRFADLGCGFGGLLISLSKLFPESLMIGMELRDKVAEYVKERIAHLRKEEEGRYSNISVLRSNAQKYLVNYFNKGQLTKMFFLFPDPHFKASNHRRRIITTTLLTEYAYVLAPGGIIYTITDVPELGVWMKEKLATHPMFEELTQEELEADPVVPLLSSATEEGQKVARNGGDTYRAIFRRKANLAV